MSNRQKRSRLPALRLVREVGRCNLAAWWPGLLDYTGISPLMAHLWLTSRCSGKCRTCGQWAEPARRQPDTAEIKQMIRSLEAVGVRIFCFMGGDVLLRPDLPEIIRFAADDGCRTHITLNAYSLTEDMAAELMKSGVDSIHLSLDSLEDGLDDIRGVDGAAGKVLAALALLRSHNGIGTALGISATLMKDTIPTMKAVAGFALENGLSIGFNLINFHHDFFDTEFSREQYRLGPVGKEELSGLLAWVEQQRKKHPDLLPNRIELDWIKRYFDDHQQLGTPCFQGALKVCVREDGDVRPCCSMEVAGNLFQTDLRDIIRSPGYIALVKKALRKDCPGCSCRYPLNLRVGLRSQLREVLLRIRAAIRG